MSLHTETVAQPLCWTPGAPFETNMRSEVRRWLRQNPEQRDDSHQTVIIRTLFERLDANLDNPVLAAYPARVDYDTVWLTVVRNHQLDETTSDYSAWRKTMDTFWSNAIILFGQWFIKPPRTD